MIAAVWLATMLATRGVEPWEVAGACAMLLRHIGYPKEAERIEMALDICGQFEKKVEITGRDTGVTGEEFTRYLMSWIDNAGLEERWKSWNCN